MGDTDVQGMLVRIEATTAQLRQEMARADSSVGQAAGKIDKSLSRVDAAFDRAAERSQAASGLIKSALAAAVGAASVGKIIETADSYSQMSDRIGMATASVGEYDQVQGRLLETAKRTYRPLSEAQELYIRTSDSLRSMGYNTSQALDVMDSFSFLLVTNSASADKASSAIDAYSKALQTGKVEADGWQSILAAMPSVVNTIAAATGKTAEEIRSLGAQGKLSLDVLTDGLQKSAEANGVLADSMGVAVRDAIQNLDNAFTVYIGKLNESHDLTGTLAAGISGLGDNFEIMAEVAGVAAAGALGLFARQLASSAAASVLATKAALEESMARKAQANAVLQVALAEQQKAQTTVFLAEKEAVAARGTAVQTAMSLQLAEARMVERRATEGVAVAQAALNRTSTGVLGLLGGPVGIAMLAMGAATAFITLSDNTGTLEKKLGDLTDPMDKLIERFNSLNRVTQSVTLRELRASIADAEGDLAGAAKSIAFEFQSSLTQAGLAGASGFMGGIAPLPVEFQRAADIVNKASKDASEGIAVDWKQVADQVREIPGVTAEMADALESGGVAASDLSTNLDKQRQALIELTGETDDNTRATRENNAAKAAADKVGQKYLEQLQKQLGAAKDKTALEAANRFIAENTDLTEGMVVAIRSVAAAKDAQKAADDAATKASKKAATEGQTAAKQQLKAFESTEEGYKRQIALINTTGDKQKDATEVQKLAFEVESGKLGKLSETQKKRLSGLAAELDALNKIKKANEDALKLAAFEAAQKTGTQSMQDGFDQDLAGIGQGQKTRDRLRADLALRQKYVADVASLNEQFNAGQISAELYASELGVLESALDKRLEAQHEYYAQLDEAQGEWLNGATEAWANYADAAQNYSQQVNDFVTSQLSTLTSSVGENMAAMILENQSLGESFRNVVNSMVSSLVKGLADMAAQWLIYQAMQLVFGKASEATAVASAAITGTAIAAAYAPAAAMASLASFGANSVPAMAGITSTTGLATTLALTGMAHDGLDAVPATGTWLLEKGERVTTANTSAKLDSTLDALMRSQVYQQAPVARVGAGMLESMGNGEATMIQPYAREPAPPVQAELPRATRRNQPSVTQNNYYPTQPDNRTANQAAAALARKQRQAARF